MKTRHYPMPALAITVFLALAGCSAGTPAQDAPAASTTANAGHTTAPTSATSSNPHSPAVPSTSTPQPSETVTDRLPNGSPCLSSCTTSKQVPASAEPTKLSWQPGDKANITTLTEAMFTTYTNTTMDEKTWRSALTAMTVDTLHNFINIMGPTVQPPAPFKRTGPIKVTTNNDAPYLADTVVPTSRGDWKFTLSRRTQNTWKVATFSPPPKYWQQ